MGAYICPTLWNNDDFWYPDSLTAVGVAENPTYNTTEKPDLWNKYGIVYGILEAGPLHRESWG